MNRSAVGLLMLCAVSACAKSSTTPSGNVCRNYPTSLSYDSGSSITVVTNAFDRGSKQLTTRSSRTAGPALTYTMVTTYRSVDDFVDEVQSIPPLTLSGGVASTGDLPYTQSNTHDGQRLTRSIVGGSSPADVATYTYTAWDGSGRPTAGILTIAPTTTALTHSYNDAARSVTSTETTGNVVVTVTQSYDANGNPLQRTQQSSFNPGSVSTRATTVSATAQVCK